MPRFLNKYSMRQSAHSAESEDILTPTYTTLLRRTAAAFAAISGLVVSVTAFAQAPGAVRLETSSGTTTATECAYGTMSVQPNGAIRVTCTGSITVNGTTTQPPPVTTPAFALSSSGGTVTAGTNTGLTMVRQGDASVSRVVLYNATGDACAGFGDFAVTFGAGDSTPKAIPQAVLKSTGTRCVITLGPAIVDGAYVSMKGSPTVATFTVGTTTGTGNPPPTGCPAVPSNAQFETFGPLSSQNRWKGDPTGQRVIIAALPVLGGGYSYMNMHWMNSPFVSTPATGTVRFSISKCPGEINTDTSNYCNQVNGVTIMDMVWANRASTSYPNEASAKTQGVCWAPESEGPWYMNIRYEFNGICGAGDTACGMLWQYY
jgi:hypothetical protein